MKAFAIPTECFPLAWPTGVPRTQHPRVAPFGRGYNRTTHLSDQIDAVYREMKLMRVSSCVISSNLPTRVDGTPRSDSVERWGAVSVEQAFAGFVALPPGDPSAPTSAPAERPWRDVLEVPSEPWTASAPASVLLLFARQQHRELIKRHHPDRGGDPSVAAAINVALAQAEAELGGGS